MLSHPTRTYFLAQKNSRSFSMHWATKIEQLCTRIFIPRCSCMHLRIKCDDSCVQHAHRFYFDEHPMKKSPFSQTAPCTCWTIVPLFYQKSSEKTSSKYKMVPFNFLSCHKESETENVWWSWDDSFHLTEMNVDIGISAHMNDMAKKEWESGTGNAHRYACVL